MCVSVAFAHIRFAHDQAATHFVDCPDATFVSIGGVAGLDDPRIRVVYEHVEVAFIAELLISGKPLHSLVPGNPAVRSPSPAKPRLDHIALEAKSDFEALESVCLIPTAITICFSGRSLSLRRLQLARAHQHDAIFLCLSRRRSRQQHSCRQALSQATWTQSR